MRVLGDLMVFDLNLRNGQQGQQFGIKGGKLVGQDIAQSGVGDLSRTGRYGHILQAAAISVADDGWAKGVVATVAGKSKQLSDTWLDIKQLLLELFFQLVGFR